MAEPFLRDYPGLKPFVLSNVQLTGTNIGGGGYGKVDEVDVPVRAAAKTIYTFLQESDGTTMDLPKAATQFVSECQLMSTLRHPNLVHFFGVTFFPGSRLPALVMERLLTSLHDLLVSERPTPRRVTPLSFFSMHLKCCVLHNVASGLAFLHERSPPIIHRDLSAGNVLLDSSLVAKIADLGVARIVEDVKAAATMTKGPGNIIYMPPEAFETAKSKYNASIDIFSFGVVTIFTISEVFPCDPLASTYTDKDRGLLVARNELQRRSKYMTNVEEKLRACNQLRGDHPIITLIQQCLINVPRRRPGVNVVLDLLEKARSCFSGRGSERNKKELVRLLNSHPQNQILVHAAQDLVTENNGLRSVVQTLESTKQDLEKELRSQISIVEELKSRNRSLEEELHTQAQVKDQQPAMVREQLQQKLQPSSTVRRASYSSSIVPADDKRKKNMLTIEKKPKEELGLVIANIPLENGFRIVGVELDSPSHRELMKGNIQLMDIVTELNEDTISNNKWFEQSTRDKTRPFLTILRSSTSPPVGNFLTKVKERCRSATHITLLFNPIIYNIGTDFGIEPVQTTTTTRYNIQGMLMGIRHTADSVAHLCGVTIKDELLMYSTYSTITKTVSDPKVPFLTTGVKVDFKKALDSGQHLLLVLERH